MNNRAIGLKIAGLTLATILISVTMSLALAEDVFAPRKVVVCRIKETASNGPAMIAVGKLKEADLTQEYTARLIISVGGTQLGMKEATINPANPTHVEVTPDVEKFLFKYDVPKNQIVAKYLRFNVDATAQHSATVDIIQQGTANVVSGSCSIGFT